MLEVLMADSSPNIIHPLSQAELWGGPAILRWYWNVPKCSASVSRLAPGCGRSVLYFSHPDQRSLSYWARKARGLNLREKGQKTLGEDGVRFRVRLGHFLSQVPAWHVFWCLEQRQPMAGLGRSPWPPRPVPLLLSVIPCR